MIRNQRGHSPLVAIAIVGSIAALGGAITTVSIQNDGNNGGGVVPAVMEETYQVPAMSEVDVVLVSTTTVVSDPVEEILPPIKASIELDTESRAICAQVKEKLSGNTKKSLIQTMNALCEKYTQGGYEEDDLEDVKENLQAKWRLWLQVREAELSTQNRARDIENTRQ